MLLEQPWRSYMNKHIRFYGTNAKNGISWELKRILRFCFHRLLVHFLHYLHHTKSPSKVYCALRTTMTRLPDWAHAYILWRQWPILTVSNEYTKSTLYIAHLQANLTMQLLTSRLFQPISNIVLTCYITGAIFEQHRNIHCYKCGDRKRMDPTGRG